MDETVIYKVAKNFSSLIIAQVVYKIITFIMVILMARFLGVKGFGQLSYGLSFVWVFLFLSDFGFSELFIRDVAAKRSLLEKYINNIITLKIFVGLATYLIIILLAWRFSFGIENFWIILILGASVILDSFIYFLRSLFRVKETMEYEGILMVIEAILKLGIVFFAIKSGINFSGAILMSLGLLSVSFINFTINLITFIVNYKKFSFAIERDLWFYLLKSAFPFALIYILSLLNFRIDIIMLSLMKGDMAAGWYNADYKLLEQFLIIPITLSYVYLPLFSRLSNSLSNVHKIFKKTILLLFLLSIGIVILCYFFGGNAIRIIYGKTFEDASRYILILSIVLLPFFIKPIIEKLLYAAGKQSMVCLIYLAGIIGNIILNLTMIPRWGINGASFATFICEMLTVLGCVALYKKFYIVYNAQRNILNVDKVLIKRDFIYG